MATNYQQTSSMWRPSTGSLTLAANQQNNELQFSLEWRIRTFVMS